MFSSLNSNFEHWSFFFPLFPRRLSGCPTTGQMAAWSNWKSTRKRDEFRRSGNIQSHQRQRPKDLRHRKRRRRIAEHWRELLYQRRKHFGRNRLDHAIHEDKNWQRSQVVHRCLWNLLQNPQRQREGLLHLCVTKWSIQEKRIILSEIALSICLSVALVPID